MVRSTYPSLVVRRDEYGDRRKLGDIVEFAPRRYRLIERGKRDHPVAEDDDERAQMNESDDGERDPSEDHHTDGTTREDDTEGRR